MWVLLQQPVKSFDKPTGNLEKQKHFGRGNISGYIAGAWAGSRGVVFLAKTDQPELPQPQYGH